MERLSSLVIREVQLKPPYATTHPLELLNQRLTKTEVLGCEAPVKLK